jgi:hypothetical protein
MKFEPPILFLIFNRPDTAKLVFERIREVKPKFLYIAADGPRENRPDEVIMCQQTREIVISGIDWDCEVKTLFREKNFGCGKAVSESITWFFQNVEMGIILEDDCLPDLSFFRFCDELLIRYKDEEKIASICGTNIHTNFLDDHSYIYSLYAGIWGWASWRRSWKLYNYDMDSWNLLTNKNIILKNLKSRAEYYGIANIFDGMVTEKRLDTWDIQWFYYTLLNNRFTIFSSKNLITNIGFGSNASHTHDKESPLSQLELNSMDFPLKHNNVIEPNRRFDKANSIKYGWHKKFKLLGFLKGKLVRIIKRNQLMYGIIRKLWHGNILK